MRKQYNIISQSRAEQSRAEQSRAERIQVIDYIRGIAILMVIWSHCGAIFTPVITFFHMPLFFYISGYLFKKRGFNHSFHVE